MNRKITFPELTALLSAQTGETKKQCEVFLKQLFATIIDSLVEGEIVKIKDLGTFRLIEVGSRKSVNVNTGMDIEIPGHRRVSFVAAKSLAEKINAPFEAFESVELSEDLSEEDLAKIDESPIIDDEGHAHETLSESESEPEPSEAIIPPSTFEPTPVTPPEKELPDEEEVDMDEHVYSLSTDDEEPVPIAFGVEDAEQEESDYVEDEKIPISNEPEQIAEEQAEERVEDNVEEKNEDEDIHSDYSFALKEDENLGDSSAREEQATTGQINASAVAADMQKSEGELPATNESQTGRKGGGPGQFGFGFIAGILSTVIIAAVVLAFIFNRNSMFNFDRDVENQKDTTAIAEIPAPRDSSKLIAEAQVADTVQPGASESVLETIEPEPVKEEVKTEKEKRKVADTKPSDTPIYDTITKKRFLTTMAKQHYGNYHLWPYIYDANKSLGHPDRIRPGTKILVPTLSSLGIDPKNPTVIANAKKRGAAIYARYK